MFFSSRLLCFYIVDDAWWFRAIRPKLDYVEVLLLRHATAADRAARRVPTRTRMNIVTRNTGRLRAEIVPPNAVRRRCLRVDVAKTLAVPPSLPASDPEYDQERCNDLRGKIRQFGSKRPWIGWISATRGTHLNVRHCRQDDRLSWTS